MNLTPEIRPPLGDLPGATVEAAERLFRARLRCHLQMKAAAIERRSGRDDGGDVHDTLMDFAAKIEANADAAWITTLALWAERRQCDDPQRWLRWCLRHALMEAVEGSFAVAAMRQDAQPGHDVDGWIREFVVGTDVEGFLRSPAGHVRFDLGRLAGTRDMNPSTTSDLFVGPQRAPFATPTSFTRGPKSSATLSELIGEFHAVEATHLPDATVPVRSLVMSERADIIVPGRGPCELTPWAKKQLASRLGITWDRWFEGIDGKLRADEVNRRLARDPGTVRVKTATGTGPGTAILRGLVSPGYATIPDALVAQTILEELRAADPKIVRQTTTDRSVTYVVQVGAPLHLAGPAQVGDVMGGLVVRNSDVGYASLIVALHVTRLVCKNGMVVAESKSIFHRAHRRINIDDLKKKLAAGLLDVPSRLQRAGELLERSGHHAVDNVEATLTEVLRLGRLPLRKLPIFLAAYAVEPNPTAFGIAQAITLGAQDPQVTPEDRLSLEQAAGEYLQTFARR